MSAGNVDDDCRIFIEMFLGCEVRVILWIVLGECGSN